MMEILTIVTGFFILLVVLGIVPVLTGALFSYRLRKDQTNSLAFQYVLGMIIMFAIMQLYSVPFTLLKCRFSTLVRWYTGTLILLCLCSLFFRHAYLGQILSAAAAVCRKANKKWIPVLLLIYVPIIYLTAYTPYIYGDDKTYLTMVNDIVASDTLYLIDAVTGESINWVVAKYALSSYWTFLAYLVKMTGIHTLVLCKTVLPFFIAPICYVVQGLLATFLFHGEERRIRIYLFFIGLLNIFGCFSWYSTSFRLYTWIWQSKAFLAIIVVPFLFYYCNLSFEKKCSRSSDTFREYFILSLSIVAACSTTLTGAGLAVLMVLLLAVMYAWFRKDICILIGAGLASCPAAVYMLLYLKYDLFVNWLQLQGVFRGIN